MASHLLIIKASCDICDLEIEHIKTIAGMFSMSPLVVTLSDMANFQKELTGKGPFQYVYLCTHANRFGFGEANGATFFCWEEFANTLCGADCLGDEAVLLLACCRGGLRTVAQELFQHCSHIDYVCGPRWTLTGADISTGFHIFIYNMQSRKEQPSTAVKRASDGTGYDFFCYDRVESEDTHL